MFFVFFFKQKKAYEMRMSDWSSDVCSSDLARVYHSPIRKPSSTLPSRAAARADARSSSGRTQHPSVPARRSPRAANLWRPSWLIVFPRPSDWEDRKSVVKGKSGSVRVDHGGRSILQKKTTTNYSTHI